MSATPSSSLPSPQQAIPLGVRFSVLEDLARNHPGLTTTQVCERFIKQETLALSGFNLCACDTEQSFVFVVVARAVHSVIRFLFYSQTTSS